MSTSPPRRLPPPWCVRERSDAFVVMDATGGRILLVRFREGRCEADSRELLTYEDARRIATLITKLPTLMKRRARLRIVKTTDGNGSSTTRVPRSWTVRECERSFLVEDLDGHGIATVYFRHDPNLARLADVLTHDEARRVSVNIARLPELLRQA